MQAPGHSAFFQGEHKVQQVNQGLRGPSPRLPALLAGTDYLGGVLTGCQAQRGTQ